MIGEASQSRPLWLIDIIEYIKTNKRFIHSIVRTLFLSDVSIDKILPVSLTIYSEHSTFSIISLKK